MGSLFGVITIALAQAAKEGDDHDWTEERDNKSH